MPRTTIAAVLAMLLFLAPAASARPADLGYPAYPTPEVAAQPKVTPERITDHPAPKADEIAAALAQEQAYSTKGNPAVGGLVLEQESTSGSGNQSIAPADDDGTPWLVVSLGIAAAALAAGGLTALVRRNRTRARVAV